MALRPTFHESWHRVAPLRPRLRPAIDMHRQRFRGQIWRVVQDPASNHHFRLNEPAYRFVGLLDGERTVDEAWRACMDRWGDEAPTQGEVIQLLGQLYSANLLSADVPGDAEAVLRRHSKRRTREIRGKLASFLFIKIPLFDPDRFLRMWSPFVRPLFTPIGLLLWLALFGFGVATVASHWDRFVSGASGVLAPGNLALLYLAFAVVKLLHELGHGFACRTLGRREGVEGEVHEMGIMLLVFIPVPYVDASSSWAFRSKWRRIVVSAAGMFVELACAAIAAVVWANAAEGSVTAAIAYNVIFVAGVSTLLFNGNPLLRYDGYYILSDMLELPNLYQRARDFIFHIVKSRVWGVRQSQTPAHSISEAWLLGLYAFASFVYRVIIYVAIILFVAEQLFIIGLLLAIGAIVAFAVVPAGKLVKFLATSPELERTRPRALVTTAVVVAAVLAPLGLIPFPDHVRADGVVEPERMGVVHAGMSGFVTSLAPRHALVAPGGEALALAENEELEADLQRIEARRRQLEARRRMLQEEDLAASQIVADQLAALAGQRARLEADQAALRTIAPLAGLWLPSDPDRLERAFVERGQALGVVADLDSALVRAVATQPVAALVQAEGAQRVEMRVRGRPSDFFVGAIERFAPAGRERLPSAALGYQVGGSVATDQSDPEGSTASERFFEVLIRPVDGSVRLLPGQRVVARFTLEPKPLLSQWTRAIRQTLQRRLRI